MLIRVFHIFKIRKIDIIMRLLSQFTHFTVGNRGLDQLQRRLDVSPEGFQKQWFLKRREYWEYSLKIFFTAFI